MEEEKCPFCNGTGSVGGLYDGSQYIEVEDCYYCNGTGLKS